MNRAKLILLGCLVAAFAVGCSPAEAPTAEKAPETPAETPQSNTGGGGGIQIHGPGGAGISPVTGTESLQGGGSGVNSVAKDRAKAAAGAASSGSMGQMPSDD